MCTLCICYTSKFLFSLLCTVVCLRVGVINDLVNFSGHMNMTIETCMKILQDVACMPKGVGPLYCGPNMRVLQLRLISICFKFNNGDLRICNFNEVKPIQLK